MEMYLSIILTISFIATLIFILRRGNRVDELQAPRARPTRPIMGVLWDEQAERMHCPNCKTGFVFRIALNSDYTQCPFCETLVLLPFRRTRAGIHAVADIAQAANLSKPEIIRKSESQDEALGLSNPLHPLNPLNQANPSSPFYSDPTPSASHDTYQAPSYHTPSYDPPTIDHSPTSYDCGSSHGSDFSSGMDSSSSCSD